MLLKLGGALLLLVLPTHLGLWLRYEPERGYAAGSACVQIVGETTPFQSHAGSPLPPFPTLSNSLAKAGRGP